MLFIRYNGCQLLENLHRHTSVDLQLTVWKVDYTQYSYSIAL